MVGSSPVDCLSDLNKIALEDLVAVACQHLGPLVLAAVVDARVRADVGDELLRGLEPTDVFDEGDERKRRDDADSGRLHHADHLLVRADDADDLGPVLVVALEGVVVFVKELVEASMIVSESLLTLRV